MIHNKMKRRIVASLLCVMMVLSILPSASVALAETESDGAPAAVEMAGASEPSEPTTPAAADESSGEEANAPTEAQEGAKSSPQEQEADAPIMLLGEGSEGEDDDSDSDDDDDGDESDAGTNHNLADYIRSLEIIGDPTSVADGDNITVRFGWLVEAGSYNKSDTFTYQLPVNFDISAAATGYITRGQRGPRVGTYTVDTNGLVTIRYNDDYNPSGQTTINYMEITGQAKYDPSDSDNEIKFIWSNGSKVVIVTNTGDFNVSKESYRQYPNNQLSNDSLLKYIVNITSENGTGGVFTITDSLTRTNFLAGDTFTYDASSFVLVDGDGKSIEIQPTIEGEKFTIENIPALKAGGSYKLTYSVKVHQSGTLRGTASVSNHVAVTSDGTTHTDTKKNNYTPVVSKAFSRYDNNLKAMRWYTTIRPQGTNLAGFTFTDTAEANIIAEPNSIEGDFILRAFSSDNSAISFDEQPEFHVDGKTFSFTFPNVEGVSYWQILYYTEADSDVGTSLEVSNTSTVISPSGETWESTAKGTGIVKGETTVEKNATNLTKNDDGTMTLDWEGSVVYDNVDNETYLITDRLGAASVYRRYTNANGDSWNAWDEGTYSGLHYAIAPELHSDIRSNIKLTVLDDNGQEEVLSYDQATARGATINVSYYAGSDKSQYISSQNGTAHVRYFEISITGIKPVKVDLAYSTKFDTRAMADGTRWRMRNYLTSESVTAHGTHEMTEEFDEDGGIDKQVRLASGIWSSHDYSFDYENQDGLLTFRLMASVPEGRDAITVTDQLPEGFTIVDGSIKVGNYHRTNNNSSYSWTNNENVSITYPSEENGNLITVSAQNIGTELTLQSDNMVVIEYQVEVDEHFESMDGATTSKNSNGYVVSKAFTNTATNGDVSDSLTTTVTRNQTILQKEGSQVTENDANTSRAHYSVAINANGLDLLEGGDELTLTDVMTSDELDFEIDRSSIKLYTADADGNKLVEVDPLELKIEQPEEDGDTRTQTFTIKVQDETAYILEYDYVADKREATSAATQGVFSNTITMEGITSAEDDVDVKGINVRVTSNHAGLQLVKVDEKNNAKFLSAEFKLEKYNKDSGAYESMGTVTMSGKDGLNFDYYSANCALEGNTLYRITETEAPEGYVLDDTPFYFIIRGNIQDVRSGDIDATNLVVAEEDAAKEAAGAPEGLDINMLLPDSGSYFEISNAKETGALKVEKKWIGQVGQSATVHLFANDVEVESVVLNAENNWKHSFENLPKTDDDDNEITYTIKEDAIDGYSTEITGDAASGFVVTNTDNRTTEVKVDKTWIGQALGSITVKLLADGNEVDRKELTEDDNWTYTFENLPAYDAEGDEITYNIEEVSIEGYVSNIVSTIKGIFVITNISTEEIEIPVSKEWIGGEEDSVTINLLADNAVVDSLTLTKDDNWSGVFTDLPKYSTEDGHEIVYAIEEVEIDGYTSEVDGSVEDGFVVTNEKDTPPTPPTPTTTSVKVDKQWVGDEGDSVTIKLLANGEEVESKTITANDNWTTTFTNLPVKDAAGADITYTIDEVKVDGYTTEITGDAASGYVVINEKDTPPTPTTTSVKVDKQWVGGEGDSVTIKLLANGEEVESKTITANDNWTTTFTNLPVKDAAGADITYTIDEVKVDGYTTEITGDAASGYVVINEKDTPPTPTTTSVKVDKQWVGGEGDSVTIKLLANGEEVESMTLTANDNWTGTFTNLPVKDAAGDDITYTIDEVKVDGYSTEITGDAASGYVVINEKDTPPTPPGPTATSVKVDKQWVGGEGDSVTVKLLANGEEVESKTITADDNWTTTFTNLPMKDAAGEVIDYTIEEVEVDGYNTVITGDAENGYTITNTIEGKISIGVTKEWKNRTGTSATIHLFADGVEVDSVELTRANNWQHTFTDLDQYKDGKEINYTIEEDAMNRYIITISGSAADGFIVTNTYNPPGGGGGGGGVNTSAYVSLTADKTLDGKTPSTNEYQFTLTDSEGKVLQTKNNNGNTVTFDRLEFDKTGTYTYTVKEVAGNNTGINYDSSVYTVTIVVTGGTFNKKAEVTYTKDSVNVNSMSFKNTTIPEYPFEPDEPTPDEPTNPDEPETPNTPTTPSNDTPSNPTTPGSKLPQTGLFWWPVGLLAAAGSTMLVASGVASRKRDEDEEE